MDDKLTPFQKLDIMLDYFLNSDKTYKQLADIKSDLGFGSTKELTEMLHKLKKDGYIHMDVNPIEQNGVKIEKTSDAYSSTFDGRIFKIAGGYEKRQSIETVRACRKNIRDWVLTYGTALAGLAGLGLLVYSIYSYIHPICN